MNGATFDTPKPIELILRMLKITTFLDKDSIILDFFSGSRRHTHAVMQLNALRIAANAVYYGADSGSNRREL